MANVKVATTGMLENLAWEADRKQRNRRVTEKLLQSLDPDGIHVVALHMHHNDVEVRTLWLCKVKGSDWPTLVFLDMSFDNFDQLPAVEAAAG